MQRSLLDASTQNGLQSQRKEALLAFDSSFAMLLPGVVDLYTDCPELDRDPRSRITTAGHASQWCSCIPSASLGVDRYASGICAQEGAVRIGVGDSLGGSGSLTLAIIVESNSL